MMKSHPHVLKLRDYFLPPGGRAAYLRTPYCGGGSLQSLLFGAGGRPASPGGGPVAPEEATASVGLPRWEDRVAIAQGIVQGLRYLHAKRIFHRCGRGGGNVPWLPTGTLPASVLQCMNLPAPVSHSPPSSALQGREAGQRPSLPRPRAAPGRLWRQQADGALAAGRRADELPDRPRGRSCVDRHTG